MFPMVTKRYTEMDQAKLRRFRNTMHLLDLARGTPHACCG